MGKFSIGFIAMAISVLSLFHTAVFGIELTGRTDDNAGAGWQSSYMDLDSIRDFKKGDKIVIRVEGSAEWVMVRLLPENGNAEKPVGLVGSKMKVPAGGKLIVSLQEDRPRVRQISVHAGKIAWGRPIDSSGGEIYIVGIDLNP